MSQSVNARSQLKQNEKSSPSLNKSIDFKSTETSQFTEPQHFRQPAAKSEISVRIHQTSYARPYRSLDQSIQWRWRHCGHRWIARPQIPQQPECGRSHGKQHGERVGKRIECRRSRGRIRSWGRPDYDSPTNFRSWAPRSTSPWNTLRGLSRKHASWNLDLPREQTIKPKPPRFQRTLAGSKRPHRHPKSAQRSAVAAQCRAKEVKTNPGGLHLVLAAGAWKSELKDGAAIRQSKSRSSEV